MNTDPDNRCFLPERESARGDILRVQWRQPPSTPAALAGWLSRTLNGGSAHTRPSRQPSLRYIAGRLGQADALRLLGQQLRSMGARQLAGGGIAAALVAVIAISSAPGIGKAAVTLLFMLAISFAGALSGLAAALTAAVAGSVAYLLFLVDWSRPGAGAAADIMSVLALGVNALVVGLLSARAQDKASAACHSNQELVSLLVLSQELQSATSSDEAVAKVTHTMQMRFGSEARVLLRRGGEFVELCAPESARDKPWHDAARAVWSGQASPRVKAEWIGFLLKGAAGPFGVLLVHDMNDGSGLKFDAAFMTAIANMLSLALERSELGESVAEARALARSEELKTALLSSVSHDLRTPLATIRASATSILKFGDKLPLETREQMIRSIVDESERLNRYTGNLLELSKLQAGSPLELAELVDAVEAVGAAIQRIRPRLGARSLQRILPERSVLVRTDPALFELVLLNVLENAIMYSDDGSLIEIEVRLEAGDVCVHVRDEGCGIPPEDLQLVFQRFHRVKRPEHAPHGSGLGLPIAKAFVEAFGGRIQAAVPGLNGRGTHIAISLPSVESVP